MDQPATRVYILYGVRQLSKITLFIGELSNPVKNVHTRGWLVHRLLACLLCATRQYLLHVDEEKVHIFYDLNLIMRPSIRLLAVHDQINWVNQLHTAIIIMKGWNITMPHVYDSILHSFIVTCVAFRKKNLYYNNISLMIFVLLSAIYE